MIFSIVKQHVRITALDSIMSKNAFCLLVGSVTENIYIFYSGNRFLNSENMENRYRHNQREI